VRAGYVECMGQLFGRDFRVKRSCRSLEGHL
jgi:hypothetical protein